MVSVGRGFFPRGDFTVCPRDHFRIYIVERGLSGAGVGSYLHDKDQKDESDGCGARESVSGKF